MRKTTVICSVAGPRTARGLSLIELMVALTIGALMIAGAVSVYMQSRNTYRTNDVASRMQEVGRYALDVISPDVRLAGYWGLTNRPDSFASAAGAVANDCGANFATDVTQPIQGRDAKDTGGGGYNLACKLNGNVVDTPDWADVLIVRRATADTTALEKDRLQVQTNRETAALFSDGSRPSGFGAAVDQSATHNFMFSAYYVAEMASINGVRQYSLRRQTLVDGPAIEDEEIIAGVQDMQVQFGLDVDADGTVDRYVNPEDAIPAGARIATVQLWLLVVSEEREIGFQDDRKYQYANVDQAGDEFHDDRRRVLLSKTIQIRNAAT